MSYTPAKLLILTLGLSIGATACERADSLDQEPGASQRTETIGTRTTLTLNTNQWVSPSARDVYEFTTNGQWRDNGYGYEARLSTISLANTPYGPVTSEAGTPPTSGEPHLAIFPGDDFQVEVMGPTEATEPAGGGGGGGDGGPGPGPGPGEPGGEVHHLDGADIVGLELRFDVRGAGFAEHEVVLQITDHQVVEGAGDHYVIHKVDPTTGESIAPLCEEDANGDRLARFYDGLSVDAKNGVITFVGQGIRHIGCSANAPGKSVQYGYGPAEVTLPQFTLANRIIRADYCADGYPYTYPGNLVAMEDNFRAGQQGTTLADVYAGLAEDEAVEAAWDEHGVLCIDLPRASNVDAEGVVCPIKHFADGSIEYNWRPPSCQGWVDANPNGDTRIYSRTSL